MTQLAYLGGEPAVTGDTQKLFERFSPAARREMEQAVLNVLHDWSMSGTELTRAFEDGFARWHGMDYGLAYPNGTAALLAAMFGVGLGEGDEMICPSITYWASCLQIYTLRASVVFCDIDPVSLCLDPADVERKITDRTKAIMAVHYAGVPCAMDELLALGKKHNIKIIEDVSHAHGALYQGRLVGTMGEVSGYSVMSGKSFAVGEAGIMLTNDREIWERGIAFGHYDRSRELTLPYLQEAGGLPWGGYKGRVHQMSSAMGLVQLEHYPDQMAETEAAMQYFCDKLAGLPGLSPHRPEKESGSTKGGWYNPLCHYRPEELGGLSISAFCQALKAEGVPGSPGCNKALHRHPLFYSTDIFGEGQPTRTARAARDVRELDGELPVSSVLQERIFRLPLFHKYHPELIDQYAAAYEKVTAGYQELLAGDEGNPADLGLFFAF